MMKCNAIGIDLRLLLTSVFGVGLFFAIYIYISY